MKARRLNSLRETRLFARALAGKRLRSEGARKNKALIFALSGELGSGKTTFAQAFLRGLGVRKKITSPTFVLIKKFQIRVNPRIGLHKSALSLRKSASLYHIDCYRIKKPSELLHLGLKEILNNPGDIVLIEWAEKIKRVLPKSSIWIKFNYGRKEGGRIIKIGNN